MIAPPEDFDRHVRRVAPDRWLAARLIPDIEARTEVLALYALDDELEKIAPAVSQPMLGEIRLQWWREALERAAGGGAADHPVIEALAPALRDGRLPLDGLERLIGSHAEDLEPSPFDDEPALVAWLDARFGSVMASAARLLDPAASDADAVVHAARAWGWSHLVRSDPAWRARGRSPWPASWGAAPEDASRRALSNIQSALRTARSEVRRLPTAAFPAVAYAALARGHARGRPPSELGRRVTLLWAAVRGAV